MEQLIYHPWPFKGILPDPSWGEQSQKDSFYYSYRTLPVYSFILWTDQCSCILSTPLGTRPPRLHWQVCNPIHWRHAYIKCLLWGPSQSYGTSPTDPPRGIPQITNQEMSVCSDFCRAFGPPHYPWGNWAEQTEYRSCYFLRDPSQNKHLTWFIGIPATAAEDTMCLEYR